MDPDEMRRRTKAFALRILRLAARIPRGPVGDSLARQIVKSGTSVGANYREALRASSRPHFASYIEICAREADETHYWLELLIESGLMKAALLAELLDECGQLIAILTATGRSTKRHRRVANPKSEIHNPKS